MSIVVLGTVALDTVKTPYGFKKDMLGGSAAHFSMSASLFAPVHVAAVIGHDFPKKNLNLLERKGVILDSILAEEGGTFKWEGEYKEGDLNTAHTLNTHLGVVSAVPPAINPAHCTLKTVFLANYDPDIQYTFLRSMQCPEFVGLDTMNFWIHNKRQSLQRIIKKVDLLVINEAEAKDLSLERNILKQAKFLLGMGPKIVIIKKGEHGVLLYSKDVVALLPAFPVEKVVDPTGAGDTFAGGVMGFLAKSRQITPTALRKAIAYGSVCASFNVEGFGMTRTAKIDLKTVEDRLEIFRGFFKGV